MEVNVKVSVDLGERTLSLFGGLLAANNAVASAATTVDKVLTKYAESEAATTEAAEEPARPKRTRTPKPAPAETAKEEATPAEEPAEGEAAVEFKDMDDDAKLEAIRGEVSKNVKKGRSSDVKFMLGQFDASNATTLSPESYDAFFDAIVRYGNGETLEAIFPSDLD